jgi:hypothetical protein
MKKAILIIFSALFFLLVSLLFFKDTPENEKVSGIPDLKKENIVPQEDFEEEKEEKRQENKEKENKDNQQPLPEYRINEVPFFPQSPFAKWDPLHEEACEEAAIIMAHLYLSGKTNISPEEADKEIYEIINYEEEKLGFGEDINAKQIIDLTENFYGHKLTAIKNYTTETIKNQLAQGNIFIAPAAGRLLENPYFQSSGPLYHALVIIGYDEKKKQFITNDPGTKRGKNFKYSYQNLMESIRDFPESGKKEDILQGEKILILVEK